MASLVPLRRSKSFQSSLLKSSAAGLRNRKCCFSGRTTFISRNAAEEFLQNKIHIQNVRAKVNENRLDLLREITQNFNRYIPFHNLRLFLEHPDQRSLPTAELIRKNGLQGEGGPSYCQALFTNWLLTTLDYDTHLIACRVKGKLHPYTHGCVLVKNVIHKGDMYLVDLGSGYPTFEPVPLRNLPQTYQHSFLNYKFSKLGWQYYRSHHAKQEGAMARLLNIGNWKLFYDFNTTERSEEFFQPYQEKLFTEPGYGNGWYLLTLKMSIYPKGKGVTLKDRTLKVWDDGMKKITEIELPRDEDIKAAIHKYFPMLKHIDIDTVLENWKRETVVWNIKQKKKDVQ